jgi:hypothetical protein
MLDHNFSPTRSMRNEAPSGIKGFTTEDTEEHRENRNPTPGMGMRLGKGVRRSFAPGKYAGLRMTRLG